MSTSKQDIVKAYRNLYRAGLRAVQYSSPARYTLRDRLRRAFRASSTSDFDQQRILNTLEFLDGAAKTTGIEHHIVKSLLMVWWHEPYQWKARNKTLDKTEVTFKTRAYDHFYHTLRMLNESMGMCIR
jgi:hypothetical protein